MTTEAIGVVDEYATANIKERIEIILDNYPSFLEIMNGFEESLKYLIINGRRMAKRRNGGDLRVRVQTSGFSDPTANAAVGSVMFTGTIRSGNVDAELERTECPEQYRKEAKVIHEMKDDYFLVRAQIKIPPWQDYRVLDSYLNGSHGPVKLAEEANCTYGGVKNRLKKARNRIRRSTVLYLERRYESN